MTTPARRVDGRVSALPDPELVSLADGPVSGWWTQYGGRLDPASGVIAFPRYTLPPCPFPCDRCKGGRDAAAGI